MKNINISILAFAGMLALNSCATKVATPEEETTAPTETVKTVAENGLDLSTFDTSVRPQDDF